MLSRLAVSLSALVAGALLTSCGTVQEPGQGRAVESAANTASSPDDAIDSVLAISVDGLNPSALEQLGPEGAPHLHAFQAAGASTLNARTEYERTNTLPNHTGMVTGRRVNARRGGHGVTWNDDRRRPATVHAAAGHRVLSVFSVVDAAGGSSALFAGKTKFSLWKRTWRGDIDRMLIDSDEDDLVDAVLRDLTVGQRELRFVHLLTPDAAGHEHGFMSPEYLDAVRRVDALVGRLVQTVTSDPQLAASTAIVLTSDHGGLGSGHDEVADLSNYRVPFMVRGPGIPAGADLYDLNPDYRDPGHGRPGYGADRQPVRNGALANLALDLLDLRSVPGSEHNRRRDLDVSPRG